MHYLVYIITITIILLLSTIAIYLRMKLSHLVQEMEKLLSQPIDQANIDFEKGLIRSAIDHALMRALYYYGTIDIKFSETSPVKNFYKGHYRDLVTYLLRQDVLIENEDDGKITRTPFFNIFVNKVYLHYVSETPPAIKRLFFKYFSGYSINTYFAEKRGKPSEIPFITDYVQNFLWNQFDTIERDQRNILKHPDVISYNVKFEEALNQYDYECLRKIYLNIYNDSRDSGTNIETAPGLRNPESNTNEKEKNNEFSVDFHEQSK